MKKHSLYSFILSLVITALSASSCSRSYDENMRFAYYNFNDNRIETDYTNESDPSVIYNLNAGATCSGICYSPDAGHIYFTIDEGAVHTLCIIDHDGSNFKQIYTSANFMNSLTVSPSGKYIGVVSSPDLLIISPEGTLLNSFPVTIPAEITMSVEEPFLFARDGGNSLIRYNYLDSSSVTLISGTFTYDNISSKMYEKNVIGSMTNADMNNIYFTEINGTTAGLTEATVLPVSAQVQSLCFSPDGNIFLLNDTSELIHIIDIKNQKLIRTISDARFPAIEGRPR